MIAAIVVLGGGLGAVLRFVATVSIGTSRTGFPLGTTFVNVIGSFVLGVIVGFDPSDGSGIAEPLSVGFLGGFTTFSTWMVELDRGRTGTERIWITAVPLLVGLAAATLGLVAGSALKAVTT